MPHSEKDLAPQIELIPISDISPSPMNPRKTFSEEAIRELADNIRKQGLLQPITVRPMVDGMIDGMIVRRCATPAETSMDYEIVCGERRYRACKMLGEFEMACIVRTMSDDEAFDAMITENLQRRDVDPMEEAEAFRLLQERGQDVAELAARFGKSESYVRNRMRLSALIPPLRTFLSNGQLTLRGAYLASRLGEDQQRELFDDEFDGKEDCERQMTTDEVEEWLDRYFMNLWHAPFHDGETLDEEWNPDGKLIRRCRRCSDNTSNQGCLFADMKTEEPQCINAECYERKLTVYYGWLLRKYEVSICLASHEPASSDIALVGNPASLYGEETRERYGRIAEMAEASGFRIFSDKELPSRIWGQKEGREAVAAGVGVRIIDLNDMARGRKPSEIEYCRIPGAQPLTPGSGDDSQAGRDQKSYLRALLCERKAEVGHSADSRIASYVKKNFDGKQYAADTSPLKDWERDMLTAMVFDYIGYESREKFIPGTKYDKPRWPQMKDFIRRKPDDGSWMRQAIAGFLTSSRKESYLEEAMHHLSIEAHVFISDTRSKARERIEQIDGELREMGFDENGNPL